MRRKSNKSNLQELQVGKTVIIRIFSDKEVVEFIDLLNQVKLGDIVDENKALSSGAVSYYTIYFATDETLTISPGKYFEVEDTYYEFDNYDELWDEFIVFNSIK